MKKQKKSQQQQSTATPLSSEQHEIMSIFEDSQKFYLSVLAQLHIDHNDRVYCDLVLGMMERQITDHLIMSIWKNMDEAQSKHLRDYINQMSVIAPFMSNDDLLLEFAMMYPELMEKVFAGLSEFSENFIKKFNEISGA